MIGNKLEPFKFWCQKVLPNVYDDSLSYYEYLCKLNEYLNEVIGQINTLTTNMEDYEADLTATWLETKEYIDNYFNNLDVQQEINNKLDKMASSGELSTLLAPIVGTQIGEVVAQQIGGTVANQIGDTVASQIDDVVAEQISEPTASATNAWLNEHVDPVGSAVIVDDTLSIIGAAADAKATGDNINVLDARIGDNYEDAENLDVSITSDGLMRRNGNIDTSSNWKYGTANVTPFTKILITGTTELGAPLYIFKDQSNNILSYFPVNEAPAQYYSDYEVYVPKNAATVIVNNYTIRTTIVKERKFISLENLIELVNENLDDNYNPLDIVDFPISGFMDYHNGTITPYSGYYCVRINVQENEEYMCTGYPWLSIKLAVLTDSYDNVLASYPETETSARIFTVEKFKTPKGCTRMYLNYNYSGGANREWFVSAYKKDGYKPTVGKKVKLGIIGDSLSAGYMVAGIRYLNLLEAHDKYEVQNFSRSGVGYKRDDDHLYSFFNQALRLPSDIEMVLCFGSFNDMPYIENLGNPTDTTNQTICGCINITIDNIYSINKGAIIGIVTPTPWQQYHSGITNADNYVNAIIEVCKYRNIAYLDLYHRSELRPQNAEFRSEYYYNSDGTHPNNLGHKLFVYPQIKSFVNSLANRI